GGRPNGGGAWPRLRGGHADRRSQFRGGKVPPFRTQASPFSIVLFSLWVLPGSPQSPGSGARVPRASRLPVQRLAPPACLRDAPAKTSDRTSFGGRTVQRGSTRRILRRAVLMPQHQFWCRFWCRFVVEFERSPSNTVDIACAAKCLRALQNR